MRFFLVHLSKISVADPAEKLNMETEVDFFLVFMIISSIILAVSIHLEHTSCYLQGFSVACNQKV